VILTYNLKRNILEDDSTQFTLGDGSTFGTTTVPIGETDQLLVVEDNAGSIGYKTWGNVARLFYVATDGVDDNTDPNRGLNYFKPFRTVRYALEMQMMDLQAQLLSVYAQANTMKYCR
jgi:hypothetical protein